LTWLADWEGEPPTIGEVHAARGDGIAWRQIYEALTWLEDRFYIEGHQIRPCKFATCGYSAPFSATEARKKFINAK
jgi:hypothetical protein